MDAAITGLLIVAFITGLRHGIDFDHVAAITDIAGSQSDRRRSLILSTLYALGHALVVLVLGSIAVLMGARLPGFFDSFMGRVVGATLLLMGGYVLFSVIRYGREVRLQSRWMLLATGAKRLWRIIRSNPERVIVIEHEHEHAHDGLHGHSHPSPAAPHRVGSVALQTRVHTHVHHHVATVPADPTSGYGSVTAFVIGALHGVGAETPTQMLLFLTAAGVASRTLGMFVLLSFVIGLVAANTALAFASAWGLIGGRRMPRLYVAMATATGVLSMALGVAYLAG